MMLWIRLTLVLTSAVLALASPAWSVPRGVASPTGGIDADGYVWDYAAVNCKAIDAVGDAPVAGDIMAFYADQGTERLVFRIGMFMMESLDGRGDAYRGAGTRAYVLLDYRDGGTMAAPDGIDGRVPIRWDAAVRLGYGPDGEFRADAIGPDMEAVPGLVRAAVICPDIHTIECSVHVPAGFRDAVTAAAGAPPSRYSAVAPAEADGERTPVRYHVITVADGLVLDEVSATNEPRRGNHNVAFAQHGNQGLTYTTVYWGERGEHAAYAGDPANPDDGYDELLDAHDYYDLPGNFHMAGTLMTGAEWHDPSFNDKLETGVAAGWAQMLTSAYAQHIMPFVYDDMNSWSVYTEREMVHHRYAQWPTVAWVPERTWLESPDADGNGINAACCLNDNTIKDDFKDNSVDAVILDDYVHCGYMNGVYDDHHVYHLDNGLKVLPLDNDFVGQMNYNAGAAMSTIWGGTSDEIVIYGNDWEVCAEVAGFGSSHPSALENYIYVLQQCSLYSDQISVWKLDDVVDTFPSYSITLQNGCYGLLGELWGYGGGCNSWYCDWASYTGPNNLDAHTPKWSYESVWKHAHDKVVSGPNNALSQAAWYVMMTNLHETGWHDSGEIADWQNRYSNHIKNANAYSEAARWAAGWGSYGTNATGCSIVDFDDDGATEAVIYNDRVMAVFERTGGRAAWVFAKGADYGYSIVGNCNVYWAQTNGDWNEVNHTAALSDVSVGGLDREHDQYSFEVVSGSGSDVELKLTHEGGAVEKRVRLGIGDPYLDVIYDAHGATVYLKSGWTPDLVDLVWDTEHTRVWDPGAGMYCGQRNTSSGATGAFVLGTGGANHNLEFTATLLEGDEIVGTGQFEFYLYAGYASAPVGGEVAELDALASGLTDVLPPAPVVAHYYPSADRLDVTLNETVQYDQITLTGIGVDENNDGVAEVTLTSGAAVLNSGDASTIQIHVASATAEAIEALTPGTLELLVAAGAFRDLAGNGNAQVTHADDVRVVYGADTKITIDGFVDPSEWAPFTLVVDDPDGDSQWHPPSQPLMNELYGLLVDWDEDFLYIAVNGQVQSNSWILYLDTDPGGPNGQTNLTAIDAWERGATFTAPGFRADFQYGCYQHQSAYDSDSFFSIDSATSTTALTDSIISDLDSFHAYGTAGGSEMAIPWSVLYGLGPGQVPPNAQFSLVCSICWDPEPDGSLGGDSAPSNLSASLPVIDRACTITIDHDGDGIPDVGSTGVPDETPVAATAPNLRASPNPFNPATTLSFSLRAPSRVTLAVYDLAGREVAVLIDGELEAGDRSIEWDGRGGSGSALPSGVYFARLTTGESVSVAKTVLLK